MKQSFVVHFVFYCEVLIGPCGIETCNSNSCMAWFNVLIGPCGIETYNPNVLFLLENVLIGPCGIETYSGHAKQVMFVQY